ncbi:MAG: hypothetical protein C5S38_02185 [Candidatus Methanophagaceae archaeon]|nr:MAG: hypothetical protein C5S38_02185 [Methanophagales archaeon]
MAVWLAFASALPLLQTVYLTVYVFSGRLTHSSVLFTTTRSGIPIYVNSFSAQLFVSLLSSTSSLLSAHTSMVSLSPDIVNGPTVLVLHSPAASAFTGSSMTFTLSILMVMLHAPAGASPSLQTVYVMLYVLSDSLNHFSDFSPITRSGFGIAATATSGR